MVVTKPLLICVVGCTAIGKTALSIKIASFFSTEIISADSRQFFKEMTIGTAVPSSEELLTVPHHFIQNRSIKKDYSVGDFEKEALVILDRLFKNHPVAVMVGGSGLYVDAVVKGLDTFPKVSSEIRDKLNKEFTSSGIVSLQEELQQVDPDYYKKVDIYNHYRLIRALEIYRSTGKPYSSFINQPDKERSFNTMFIGLTADRGIVYDRINQRVDIMVENGLIEEAKGLLVHKELNALQTVGYRELFQYFEGSLSHDEAISEIKKNTRRFSKRQNTWFKKNKAIHWFDYETTPSEIIQFIQEKK
ncbi:MAG: tRNA (adenosine(37)-N6)-dimethylallyltransferase MiaA [Flavobacteriaceae bacterium]|nr:tRNA (adenosine(37)-N6)-dimethylallyltransferase MiaA [Flavobacteriaceae bacterium]